MSTNKKIITLLIILAVVGAGVLVYKFVIKKSMAPQSAMAPTIEEIRQQEFNNALKKSGALDQDLDGISDSEEIKYQTSATSSDTDEDGLTDYQEISDLKTNPLKADTDGDGKADGYEVRYGLNPTIAEKGAK